MEAVQTKVYHHDNQFIYFEKFKKLVEETFVEHKNKMNKLTPMQDHYYLRDRVDLLEK